LNICLGGITMSNQITCTVSDSDRDYMTLALYRQLTPEERAQVNAYLAQLLASRYIPVPFPAPRG
jgi:hypothetical protein